LDQVEVRVDSEADRGQHKAKIHDVVGIQSSRFCELQPFVDAAHVLAATVLIDNTLHPRSSDTLVDGLADDGGVFARNHSLVIEAVLNPRLHLAPSKLALMHQLMEWMLIVIRGRADRAQASRELVGAERIGISCHCYLPQPSPRARMRPPNRLAWCRACRG